MSKILRKSSNTNTNASAVTRRLQSKESFAGALQYRQAVNNGCIKVPLSTNPQANHDSSIIPLIANGASFTTPIEELNILANSCSIEQT